MRVAISNIAWDIEEDNFVAELLVKYKINAVDIAPSKYFPDPFSVKDEDIAKVKAYWEDKGIEISGMQALLFGTQGLNVFGSLAVQKSLLEYLGVICRIAGKLGATRLVFGSPKNRDCSNLTDCQTQNIAINFFRKLGDIAQANGVIICLEPNPVCYGANFLTNSTETLEVVQGVNHPSIKMQLDTGAITINEEAIENIISLSKAEIGHIHISEPNLLVVGDLNTDHTKFATAFRRAFDNPLICIEMLATKDEPHLASIERALKHVTQIYRDGL